MQANYYNGSHLKPSMKEITDQFKKVGYFKHFKCVTCHKPSVRLISTKAEANVERCAGCSDATQRGAQRKRRLA